IERKGPGPSIFSRGLGKLFAAIFPTQSSLQEEFTARFRGPHRRLWYLTDGGHFENMGGYELIRRRLPLVIIFDTEQDKDYEFSGLANFVRKARIDFQTEIEFLGKKQFDSVDKNLLQDFGVNLTSPAFGSLEELRSQLLADKRTKQSGAHASVAIIRYP